MLVPTSSISLLCHCKLTYRSSSLAKFSKSVATIVVMALLRRELHVTIDHIIDLLVHNI